jgi:N-acyl-phosphatidylethanolamine-hydrolysing phospholipase D
VQLHLGRIQLLLLGGFVGWFSLGCATVNEDYQSTKKHHLPNGFQNNYTQATDKSTLDLLRWTLNRWKEGLPKPPKASTPVVAPDMEFVLSNTGSTQTPAVTWIGHATMLVQIGGLNILLDPVFSQRASPVQFAGPKRHQAPGIALDQLPPIDLVLISHNHYDHLDTASVQALSKQAAGSPLFVVPLGVKKWMLGQGVERVQQLDWWDTLQFAGLEVHFTPVQHWSARSLTDRRATLWGGYALLAPDFHLYFSGDAGYSPDFKDTQQHFASRQTPALGGGFDLALIAVGAYEPRWFMKDQHVNPAEAVQVHLDLKAKRSIGVHWGTFDLTDESLDQPPIDLAIARRAKGMPQHEFDVMAIGQTLKLLKRRPTHALPEPVRQSQ